MRFYFFEDWEKDSSLNFDISKRKVRRTKATPFIYDFILAAIIVIFVLGQCHGSAWLSFRWDTGVLLDTCYTLYSAHGCVSLHCTANYHFSLANMLLLPIYCDVMRCVVYHSTSLHTPAKWHKAPRTVNMTIDKSGHAHSVVVIIVPYFCEMVIAIQNLHIYCTLALVLTCVCTSCNPSKQNLSQSVHSHLIEFIRTNISFPIYLQTCKPRLLHFVMCCFILTHIENTVRFYAWEQTNDRTSDHMNAMQSL